VQFRAWKLKGNLNKSAHTFSIKSTANIRSELGKFVFPVSLFCI